MARLTSICVYCGSSAGDNPLFTEAAVTLGRAMAEAGIRLVYAGGSVGLMGAVARATVDAGGAVTGFVPRFLLSREGRLQDQTETILDENLHDTKMLMFEHADAFVALPGGVGTLEELVEQITWAQLGQHRKPILLANIAGFWDALFDLLNFMGRQGFIRPGMEISYLVAERAADIVPTLLETAAELGPRDLRREGTAPISRM